MSDILGELWDVIIIGGGPAGLTAGLYCARARLRTLLLERGLIGGQATSTDWIENYPGFVEGIAGPDLMLAFHAQAERFGLELKMEEAVELEPEGPYRIIKTGSGVYRGKSVIIASGAHPRLLGIAGETNFYGRGVSYCATCDGAFFQDRVVAVVGGGDAAVEEAIYLTRHVSRVYLVHRRDSLRAAGVIQERAFRNPKITILWNTVMESILGEAQVTAMRVRELKTRQSREIPVDGVFVYVGVDPNTAFVSSILRLNREGYVCTDHNLQTSVPGVFAVGDVRDKDLRQIATAVGDGAMVSTSVERYLASFEQMLDRP